MLSSNPFTHQTNHELGKSIVNRNTIALLISATSVLLAATTTVASTEPTATQKPATTIDQIFNKANILAAQGDYPAAISRYTELVESGLDDPDVYFNLATTFAKSEDYPRAIFYYERALKLRPNDRGSISNLKEAEQALENERSETEGEAMIHRQQGIGQTVFHRISNNALAYILLVSNLLLFIGLSWRWIANRRVSGIMPLVIVSAALLGLSAIGLGVKTGAFEEGHPAIAIENRVLLREGPYPKAKIRAEARGGDRGEIIGQEAGEFIKFQINGGSEGWALNDEIGII